MPTIPMYIVLIDSSSSLTNRLKVAQLLEEEYFSTHPVYKTLDPTKRGCVALCKKLTECLVSKAKELLPSMK